MKKNLMLIKILFAFTSILVLSNSTKAFTFINPWPSCEKPLVIVPDSLYSQIDSTYYSVLMRQTDNNGNYATLFSFSNIPLNDVNFFTELGAVQLSGVSYRVFRFTYSSYTITPGYIGMLYISGGGYKFMKACSDCSVTPYSCIGRFPAIWAYNNYLRLFVNYQPFSDLSFGDQTQMARLIDWYFGYDSNSPLASDYLDLLSPDLLGNSSVPTSLCNSNQHNCPCHQNIRTTLDSLAQLSLLQEYNVNIMMDGMRSSLVSCDCLSDYYIFNQSSDDSTQDFIYLIPLKANLETWILHFAEDSVYRISSSYNYTGGINGLYGGSVYSNGTFTNYNGFEMIVPPCEMEVSTNGLIFCPGDIIEISANCVFCPSYVFDFSWYFSGLRPDTVTNSAGITIIDTASAPGNYLIMVCAKYWDCDSNSWLSCCDQISITVLPVPFLSIMQIPDTLTCETTTVCFTDSSYIVYPGGELYQFPVINWHFYDSLGNEINYDVTQPGDTICFAFPGPGTYTVMAAAYNICGEAIVYDTLVIPPPLAFFTYDMVCIEDTVCFTDLSLCPAFWHWDFGDGTYDTVQNPCHVFTGPGPDTVTLIINNDSVRYSEPVIFYPLPPHIQLSGVLSTCDSTQTYIIQNYSSHNQYFVDIDHQMGLSINGNSFTIDWSTFPSGATLYITTSTAQGCITYDTIDIPGCCDKPNSVLYNHPTFTAQSQWTTNHRVTVNGTMHVKTNLIINDQKIFLGANARIIIYPGFTLTLTRDTLMACDTVMWDGIYIVDSTSTLIANTITVKSTVIRDAKNAVVSDYGGMYDIRGVFFRNNYKCVLVKNYPKLHNGILISNHFECTSAILPQIPAIAGIRTLIGVDINYIGQVNTLQGLTVGPGNTFNNLCTGIRGYWSNVLVRNNSFYNCNSIPGSLAKAAIHVTGFIPLLQIPTTKKYSLIAGGLPQYGNIFSNCLNGIYSDRNMDLDIRNNTFTDMQRTAISFFNSKAIYNTITISGNQMTNMLVGIMGAMNTISNTHISRNVFNSSTGIGIDLSGTNSVNEHVTINLLNRMNIPWGIRLNNLRNPVVEQNRITLNSPSGTGIAAYNCLGVKVGSNDVTSPDSTQTSGILIQDCPNMGVYCNKVTGLAYGLVFKGNCISTYRAAVQKNNMKLCKYGLVKSDNGLIGPQGDLSYPSDNTWTNVWKHTWCFSSDGSVDTLYVRNNGVWNPTIYPIDYTPPGYAFTKNTNAVGPHRACTWMVEPRSASLYLYSLLAEDSLMFSGVDQNSKYLRKQSLYRLVKEDSAFFATDPELMNFQAETDLISPGKFYRIENKINRHELVDAAMLNQNVEVNNLIEENLQEVNSLLINGVFSDSGYISAEDTTKLLELANDCPFIEGTAVYLARSVIAALVIILLEYTDDCSAIPGSGNKSMLIVQNTEEADWIKVYPNPASDDLKVEYRTCGDAEFEINNYIGSSIFRTKIKSGTGTFIVDVTSWAQAIYYYRFVSQGRLLKSGKVVILK